MEKRIILETNQLETLKLILSSFPKLSYIKNNKTYFIVAKNNEDYNDFITHLNDFSNSKKEQLLRKYL